MARNKLILLLSSLQPEEWKSLRRYALSKTRKESDNFKLFEYLYKNQRDLASKWSTERIQLKLFPGVSRKSFLNMMSVLYSWAESWLVVSKSQESSLNSKMILLKEFTSRGLYKIANQLLPKIERELSGLDNKNLSYNVLAKELYHTLYFSDNPIKYKMGSDLLEKLITHHVLSSIEFDYLYLSELHNWELTYDRDFSNLRELLKMSIPIGKLASTHHLYLIYKMVVNNDYKAFLQLKDRLISESWDNSSQTHALVTFYLITWCMKFWRKGKLTEVSIITNLYDYGLRSGVFLNNNGIPEIRFHNIVSTIGGLSETNWTLSFINEWGEKVLSKDPAQNKKLALAQFHFYEKQYGQITPILRDLKFDSRGQQIRLMGLQLIAWYEERDRYPQMLSRFITSFKQYLRRNKRHVGVHYHDSHFHLITILHGLSVNKDIHRLRKQFNSYESIIYKHYLQSRLGLL